MTTNTLKILRLSRPGGGKLEIHPDEWPALQQAVTEALQLVPAPEATLEDGLPVESEMAVSFEELPQKAFRVPSPLGQSRTLIAQFVSFNARSPLAGHWRTNFGSD